MIKLHFPIIKERYHNLEQINYNDIENIFKDITSNAINNNLFNSSEIRNTIVRIFGYIEPWLYLKTNIKLIDNNLLPLIGNESIEIILKGDNVINFYFNTINNKKISNDNLFYNTKFFNKNTRYFKTSNFDFDLNIKTDNSNRFEIIEKFCLESLTEIFNYITDNFDVLFTLYNDYESLELIFNNDSISDNETSIKIDYSHNELNKLKKIMAYPNFLFSMNYLINPTLANKAESRQINTYIIKNITSEITQMQQKTNNIIFYPYIYYFTKILSGSHKFKMTDYGFENIIKNEIKKHFKILAELSFYGKNKINNIIKDIINDINKLKNDYKCDNLNKYENDMYCKIVEINDKLSNNDIKFMPNQSLYIYNNYINNIIETINDIPKKYHNIIIDQSYSRGSRNNNFIIDYDNITIQLNILLSKNNNNNNYKIPINLFNIDIIRINSTVYNEIMNMDKIIFDMSNNNNILSYIKIYTNNSLIYNLIRNLFDETHFLPWYVDNYDEKLFKLLFIINLI